MEWDRRSYGGRRADAILSSGLAYGPPWRIHAHHAGEIVYRIGAFMRARTDTRREGRGAAEQSMRGQAVQRRVRLGRQRDASRPRSPLRFAERVGGELPVDVAVGR